MMPAENLNNVLELRKYRKEIRKFMRLLISFRRKDCNKFYKNVLNDMNSSDWDVVNKVLLNEWTELFRDDHTSLVVKHNTNWTSFRYPFNFKLIDIDLNMTYLECEETEIDNIYSVVQNYFTDGRISNKLVKFIKPIVTDIGGSSEVDEAV